MGRKKGRPSPLFIPPRPQDFIPDHPPSGICLLCDAWLGVNCGDHDHPVPIAEAAPQHFPQVGSPLTPHIILSPEIDDTPPEFPEDENETENKDVEEQKSPDSPSEKEPQVSGSSENVATSQPSAVENCVACCDQDESDCPPPEEPREIVRKFTLRKFKFPSDISISRGQTCLKSRPISSVCPSDKESVIDMEVQGGPVPLRHNNRSATSSNYNMSCLDPLEHLQRKTRRHSMIDMMRRASSQSNLINETPFNMRRSTSRISISASALDWGEESNESLIMCLSALYGKLLVVLGMAFPIAEIISDDVPLTFYTSFYLFLYFGSIGFLTYAYLFLLRVKALPLGGIKSKLQTFKRSVSNLDIKLSEIPMPDTLRQLLPVKKEPTGGQIGKEDGLSVNRSTYKPPKYTIIESSNHGSMYLKMGAVVFGIGSMIYSGLEFGQYFELRSDPECGNILMALTPTTRMIFTFLQMYFIFLNSRVAISKHTNIARFGLMHMIGTNLCIWLNVLVQETKHEIVHLTHQEHKYQLALANIGHGDNHSITGDVHLNATDISHNRVTRSLIEPIDLPGCRRINLMGNLVNSASPFLFPCTIEYSLLCAGVIYVMWKNINLSRFEKNSPDGDSDISNFIARKVRHHYSVDCARASRGLFLGIFVLVLTIISLILFYVLITNEEFKTVAILEANIIEVSIYSMAIITVLMGMRQMRELEFIPEGDIELDNILLLIAQAGVFIYTSFTIIGWCFSLEESPLLPLVTAILTLVQTTLQTIFILDGSRRCCYTPDQHDRKPGREMVTFLLVCNLSMWAISTFETSRADVHPVQLHFYGIWAWTIISHVSMPLAIFYRFHVTVCLGEIWKRSYKLKHDFMPL